MLNKCPVSSHEEVQGLEAFKKELSGLPDEESAFIQPKIPLKFEHLST